MQRVTAEMRKRFREFDWGATPIGPPRRWPGSWRTAVQICLASGSPTALALGPDNLYFYNDAFIPLGGPARHPHAIGLPVREVWREIWHPVLESHFRRTLSTGLPTGAEQLMLPLQRSGYVEETYMTFSFAALEDDEGTPSGIFCTACENTALVITRRQRECLRRLAAECVAADSPSQACRLAAAVLDEQDRDIPFALFYLPDGERFQIAFSAGLSALPRELKRAGTSGSDPCRRTLEAGGTAVLIESLGESLAPLLRVGRSMPRTTLALAVPDSGSEAPCCILVAGLNPLRPLEESSEFLRLVAAQVEKAIAQVKQRAAERLAREQVERNLRARDEFFAALAHELRSPVSSILMWSQALVTPILSRRRRLEALDAMDLAARTLHRLAEDLHDVAHTASADVRVQCRLFASLTPLVEAATAAFAPAAAAKRIRIRTSLERDSGPVRVDPVRMQQVISNLLSNAVRYTPSGGWIEVSCKRDAGTVEVRVRDSGRGITAQALPHVFERYWRGRATHDGGLGLGLAIAQRLMRLQGGQIEAASEGGGRGATFIVTLPVASTGSTAAESIPTTPSTPLQEAARIAGDRAARQAASTTSGE